LIDATFIHRTGAPKGFNDRVYYFEMLNINDFILCRATDLMTFGSVTLDITRWQMCSERLAWQFYWIIATSLVLYSHI